MNWIKISILSVILLLAGLRFIRDFIEMEWKCQEALFVSQHQRPSITFLLGSDHPGQFYFDLAEKHFLSDSQERTDQVVKSCLSLSSVFDYLNKYKREVPWGVINVVVHGNMWGGLSIPIWPDGDRAFPKELFAAAFEGNFPVPECEVFDTQTKINFWACGIGKNPLIKMALERICKNDCDAQPQVYVSPHFVIFHQSGKEAAPVRIRASYWPYFFKRGYRPSQSEIAQQLAQQFPGEKINWEVALENSSSKPVDSILNSPFSNEFHVPIVWTVLYDDKNDRPDISVESLKMAWIREQPELMSKIEDLEIPIDKYNWTVDKIIYQHPDGRHQPAIKAIGMCTVLCLLSPVEEGSL